jgi:hypothetical protein
MNIPTYSQWSIRTIGYRVGVTTRQRDSRSPGLDIIFRAPASPQAAPGLAPIRSYKKSVRFIIGCGNGTFEWRVWAHRKAQIGSDTKFSVEARFAGTLEGLYVRAAVSGEGSLLGPCFCSSARTGCSPHSRCLPCFAPPRGIKRGPVHQGCTCLGGGRWGLLWYGSWASVP